MSNATRRIVTTRMTLDLSIPDIQRDVTVTQGDTNRRFEITLVDSGHPYVLNANDKWTVILTGVKPSGATLNNGCDVAGGKILYDFASGDQITTEAGAFSVQFNIYDELGEVIATPKIWVTVTPNANRNPVIEDQYTAVSDWIATLNQYEKSEGTREANENTRQANEDGRVSAENARAAAEEQRKLNEAARATLQQQVDNLLNTPAGSTTADLALYDLKLGADGVIYETPGIAVRTQFGRLHGKVPEIDKRLANVESLLDPQLFVEDNTVSAVKDVPENAAPYAKLLEIGGMTYKEGEVLRSAAVTEVESVGANLIPYPYKDTTFTKNGLTFTDNGDGSLTVNGTTTNQVFFYLKDPLTLPEGTYYLSGCPKGGSWASYVLLAQKGSTSYADMGFGIKIVLSESTTLKMSFTAYSGSTFNNVTFYPMLNKGTTALPYAPYTQNTLPIPAEVQALNGYGWGVNANCYNYIDWEKKKFVKRVGCVDLGTLEWGVATDQYVSTPLFRTAANLPRKYGTGVGTLLCEKYESAHNRVGLTDKKIAPYNDTTDNRLCVVDLDFSDAATFKAAMAGVMLYYELAEPVVTDISDLLPADNYIGVESGGTVTMVSEYGYDVPSKVRYQLKRS